MERIIRIELEAKGKAALLNCVSLEVSLSVVAFEVVMFKRARVSKPTGIMRQALILTLILMAFF